MITGPAASAQGGQSKMHIVAADASRVRALPSSCPSGLDDDAHLILRPALMNRGISRRTLIVPGLAALRRPAPGDGTANDGLVSRPSIFSLDDLKRIPAHTQITHQATLKPFGKGVGGINAEYGYPWWAGI